MSFVVKNSENGGSKARSVNIIAFLEALEARADKRPDTYGVIGFDFWREQNHCIS